MKPDSIGTWQSGQTGMAATRFSLRPAIFALQYKTDVEALSVKIRKGSAAWASVLQTSRSLEE